MTSPGVHWIVPWLLPALIVIEVVLVASGRLGLGTAVWVALGFELLLGLAALGGGIAAVRRYRAGRSGGIDGWAAAEDALAQLLPRRLARLLLLELRLPVCLARWGTGRHEGLASGSFGYHRGIGAFSWIVFGLVLVEGAVLEIVLAAVLPGTPWPWISLALHLYALLWLAGLQASLVTRPHRLTAEALLVRDGIGAELTVPYRAITSARADLSGTSAARVCGSTAPPPCSPTATRPYGSAWIRTCHLRCAAAPIW